MPIRRATSADLETLGVLAGELVRQHHATDPARFLLVPDVERGYARWFGRELNEPNAVILVATPEDDATAIAGYAYGRLEARDWNLLLDAHGAIHDVYVRDAARRGGHGRALVTSLVRELEGRGAVRIVLSTMVGNVAAQKLFAACGFRATMLEMTRS